MHNFDPLIRSALTTVTLHTFFLSTLMAIGMAAGGWKKARNRILAGLFLAYCSMIFHFFLYQAGYLDRSPHLNAIGLPGLFLMGPMIYFLARISVEPSFVMEHRTLRHIIPAFIAPVAGWLGITLGGPQRIPFYFNFFGNRVVFIVGCMGGISITLYLVRTGKLMMRNHLCHPDTLKNNPPALISFVLLVIFLLTGVTDSLSVITQNYLFLQLAMFLVSISVIILFLLNLIYPRFEKTLGAVAEKERRKRTLLTPADRTKLRIRLDRLMHQEKIFRDEALSLVKLAAAMNITTHQLSEFINTEYGKNYTSFINGHRVEEARQLLLAHPEYTVLAIAFDVGFKSKSVFNDTFRKITGLTPSRFRTNEKITGPDL